MKIRQKKISLRELFPGPKPIIIAMVHIFYGALTDQLRQAFEDVERLQTAGVDGLLLENYGWGYADRNNAEPNTLERMITIMSEVKQQAKVPIGVNILPNDFVMSFQAAWAVGARFIQMDHVVGRFVGCRSVDPDQLREIKDSLPNILVFGGIHPKYYTLENPAKPIAESAKEAMGLADVIVVTGKYTGGQADIFDIRKTRQAIGPDYPLFVGSGVNMGNAQAQMRIADGAIVGTAFKKRGVAPGEPVDLEMAKVFMEKAKGG